MSESVAHPSGNGLKPGQVRTGVIDQAAENRPVKEGVFTPSLLLCHIKGAQGFLMYCITVSFQKEMEKKKSGLELSVGMKNFCIHH